MGIEHDLVQQNTTYDDHIFLSFGMYLPGQSSFHLYMPCQLLQSMTSGHIKVIKGTGHVFYMATPCHATESAGTEQEFFIFLG